MLLPFLLSFSTAVVADLSQTYLTNPTQETCNFLYKTYPDDVFFPGSSRYAYENTYSWAANTWLGPACVFCPDSAQKVSDAVVAFERFQVPFSIRGGGAMPVENASNIDSSGIMISSSNFTTLKLADNKETLSVGPGRQWTDVYTILEPYNLAAVGGRLGTVGVTGFLLGGGMGFFSYERGLAATNGNVRAFEACATTLTLLSKNLIMLQCVLANGSIIEANLTNEYSDLFWALKGGGNSFCIITRVDLHPFNNSGVYIGNIGFGNGTDVGDRWSKSVVDLAIYGGEYPKSSIEGQARWSSAAPDVVSYWAFLFDSGDNPEPPGLQNFTAPTLPITSGNLTNMTMKQWVAQFPSQIGYRKRFITISIPADVKALGIVMDTYFEAMKGLTSVTGFGTTLTTMPVTDYMVHQSNQKGGNPMGLNVSSAPSVWLVESPSWKDSVDDQTVLEAHRKVNVNITAKLAAAGIQQLPFFYPNDADTYQPVFEGYGAENLQKLKDIRNKYDPKLVYTDLMRGGQKVANS